MLTRLFFFLKSNYYGEILKIFSAIAVLCLTLVLILILFVLPSVLDGDASKTRIETLASQALSMEARVDGPLEISWLPRLQLSLGRLHIGEEGQELLVTEQAKIGIAMLPLLLGRVQIQSIELDRPNIVISPGMLRNADPEALQSMQETLDVREIAQFSMRGATVQYMHGEAQASLSALGCSLQMQDLQLPRGSTTKLLESLAFTAELSCEEFQYNGYSGTDLKIVADAADGVIGLAPVTMQFLGGQGVGSLQADYSEAISRYQLHYVLPQLQLRGLLNTLPPDFAAAGSLDLTLNLAMQGDDATQLMKSAEGTIFLHGAQLTLTGIDLDEKFEQFELSQNFNLIDAGAFFFAGPLGLLATKGYDFTSLLARSNGNTEITSLISDWEVAGGVARAVDVAMATTQYRVALQGQLDLVNAQFVDVTMAMIDRDGCSLVRQNVHGSFVQPNIDPPQILNTIAGPVLKLFQQGAALFTDDACEAFYTGKVIAPE